jgi:CDP-diacylglycerol--serine O-phosphatidyltransferase
MAALKTSPLRYVIPNGITIFAVFLAFLSAHYAINGDYQSAAWFIIFCFIADTVDGGVARMLNASSAIGQELDSLADVINLGIVPGILVYQVYEPALGWGSFLLGFIHTVAVAGRLARFNTTGKESREFFLGLPSPHVAAAITTFILFSDAVWGEYRYAGFVVVMVIGLAALMFSNMRFESSYFIAPGNALASWQGWVFTTAAALMVIWPRHIFFLLTVGMILQGPVRSLRRRIVKPA